MEEKTKTAVHENVKSPSDHLRDLVRELSKHGVTNADLARSISEEWDWTSAAIKQLVSRSGHDIRTNPKNTALVDAVKKLIHQNLKGSQKLAHLSSALSAVDRLRVGEFEPSEDELERLTKYIDERLKKLRRASSQFEWPRRTAFARWDWERRRLVTILIEIRTSPSAVAFVMKISGTTSQRIVIGTVSTTTQNTVFSGLAYELATPLEGTELANVNAFNVEELQFHTGLNEIGMESFCVSNSFLHRRTCSVTFLGLDGSGNPIAGLGEFIKVPEFGRLNINESAPSTAECTKNNEELTSALNSSGSITIGPNTIGEFAHKPDDPANETAHIGTVQTSTRTGNLAIEGWAYLRPGENGETDVLYSQARPKRRNERHRTM